MMFSAEWECGPIGIPSIFGRFKKCSVLRTDNIEPPGKEHRIGFRIRQRKDNKDLLFSLQKKKYTFYIALENV